MSMQNLLRDYGLNTNEEYYEMVIDSYVYGHKDQAQRRFQAMPQEHQKKMISKINQDDFSISFYDDMYEFFVNLL